MAISTASPAFKYWLLKSSSVSFPLKPHRVVSESLERMISTSAWACSAGILFLRIFTDVNALMAENISGVGQRDILDILILTCTLG